MKGLKKKPWDWAVPRVIYVIKNLINKKVYVGFTKQLEKRMKRHISGRENSLIGNAILKYGVENFYASIVHHCANLDEAEFWEKFYIEAYDCFVPKGVGYNLTAGGLAPFTPASYQKTRRKRKERGLSSEPKVQSRFWTKYLGVGKSRSGNRFAVSATIQSPLNKSDPGDSKAKVKYFKTAELAAEAYDKIALKIYGNDAVLNFPDKKEKYLEEDLNAFYEFFMTRDRPKNAPYKFVSKDKSPLGKKFGKYKFYISGRLRTKFLNNFPDGFLKMGSFDTAEEAAKFADKVMFFYDLSLEYNFPEIAEKFDRNELAAFFAEKTFRKLSKYPGVSKNRSKWMAYFNYKGVQVTVGSFLSAEDAHEAREEFMKSFTDEKFEEIQAAKALKIPKRFGSPGITFAPSREKWVAKAYKDKKVYVLGYFVTEQEAYDAREKFIKDNGF